MSSCTLKPTYGAWKLHEFDIVKYTQRGKKFQQELQMNLKAK